MFYEYHLSRIIDISNIWSLRYSCRTFTSVSAEQIALKHFILYNQLFVGQSYGNVWMAGALKMEAITAGVWTERYNGLAPQLHAKYDQWAGKIITG